MMLNNQWVEIRKSGNFKEIASELNTSPIIARIMRNRGMENISEMKAYLHPELSDCHSYSELKGMNILVNLMSEKICEKQRIRIIGDYDVDGISATVILYKGLRFLGADCDYTIPHRVEDGYGINIKLIDEAKAAGVDTIITCDNGISAREQTEHASELGMTMVITDHHEVPFEMVDGVKMFLLPNADAIVDPKMPGDTYPYTGICGAVVALKVVEALGDAFGKTNDAEFAELMKELLEPAALATVCDVMDIRDENRAIVKFGLEYMAHSRNIGLRALIKAVGIEDKKISPYHCGFILGPTLNATGRLDTSLRAVELLLCENKERAMEIALELKEINESRKQLTLEQSEIAINMVLENEVPDKVIVLLLPECHESLAGIIAGRVKERFMHPCFVLTPTENGLKGSGRSIEAYDMYDNLTKAADWLSKFGGHKMAAGISLPAENFNDFKKCLNDNCTLEEKDFVSTVRIDMEMPFSYANLDLCRELESLEPCGNGNERPLFAKLGVTFISGRVMGKNNNAARYRVSDGFGVYDLTYFGDISGFEKFVEEIYGEEKARLLHSGMNVDIKLDICYQVSINSFRGNENAQITMKYFR